jgi:hypothetical protein
VDRARASGARGRRFESCRARAAPSGYSRAIARIAAFALLALAVLAVGVGVAVVAANVGPGTALLAVVASFGAMALLFGVVGFVLRRFL